MTAFPFVTCSPDHVNKTASVSARGGAELQRQCVSSELRSVPCLMMNAPATRIRRTHRSIDFYLSACWIIIYRKNTVHIIFSVELFFMRFYSPA